MENGSRYPSEQTKAAISAKMKGRTFTQQHKEHLSAALKNFYSNDANFPNDKAKKIDYIGDGLVV